ncbi:MAG TPA: hypothetical protein VKI62_04715, partial [Bacteroidota bacterium]|nr:hypothetical protein [Bacteroidota bacterium]
MYLTQRMLKGKVIHYQEGSNMNNNMFYRKSIFFFSICFIAITLLSCSTSRLTNTWKDASYNSGPMTNMIVIAVKKNPLHRRLWEDGFA